MARRCPGRNARRRKGQLGSRTMIAETGHYALILALAVALVQTVLPLWGTRTRDPQLMAVAVPAAQMQFLLIAIAFAALMTAYVTSDFSLENVWANSHSAKPLIYKIAGVWGNHEGSMVLWVLILALFGAAVATYGSNLPRELQANALAVQGSIAAAFLLFIITTSNPFTRLDPAPLDGQGLNPVLQDPALAFHPPFLYTGYVGFSMAFSFAIAALIDGRIDAAWARWVRPWTLAAWMCLTLGIAMGSWWAYYELGWGGFWFWDPVENASFMPWLAGTALLHSALVMEKRDALKVWTILLAIITFSLSLMGTFLVRSGVLTSVHAFAVDPARGVFILAIMGIFIGGALTLFAIRAPLLAQGGLFAPISREGAWCSTISCSPPLAPRSSSARSTRSRSNPSPATKISVGPPFFNLHLRAAHRAAPDRRAVRADARLEAGRHCRRRAAADGGGDPRARGCDSGSCLATARALARASRHRARRLADRRGAVGDRLRVKLFEARLADAARRFAQSAALGLWHDARPCRARARGDRHRRDHRLAVREHPGDEAGARPPRSPATARLQGRGAAPGTELPRAGRAVRGDARRRGGDRARAVQARVHGGAEQHHRSRHSRELARRSLCGARRSAEGRRLQRPALFQSAGRLIWLGALVMFFGGAVSLSDRRLRVGAPKRAQAKAARPPAGRIADGLAPALLSHSARAFARLSFCSRAPAKAVQPDEVLPDPALEARARAISEGLRCLVCQNQSIDDFGSAARQGSAGAGARAAEGRRQRSADRRLHRRALWRIRAAQAPLRAAHRCCCGSPRRRCFSRRLLLIALGLSAAETSARTARLRCQR